MSDPNWKKAEARVKKALKKAEALTKTFWPNEYTDTYAAQGMIVQENPADMWFLKEGTFGLIEVKTCEQKLFPFKDIRPSQLVGATRCIAAGGVSIFLLCQIPEWQWYYVDGQTFLDLRRSGHKSMPWSDMTPIKLIAEEFLP